jgi:hypothetical protein
VFAFFSRFAFHAEKAICVTVRKNQVIENKRVTGTFIRQRVTLGAFPARTNLLIPKDGILLT